ncbi:MULTISPECIES: hypothetical protein [unclassified Acinetobacter]|uniref:hypothetical protein n=1 Tax=unclassified Acinetobacter TaxID=196816 RepID=UPI0029350B97|nr:MULTISPECIES: hypothetical protein [unclassified Acinetobacter]WOE31012.1 hypothetical protein QSG84_11760 [Acinetobacter sp. SAAs470]WOE39208.1 hypothetical protein QSG86_05425 [Acinetobacter sp. SAAs474]
MPSFSQYLSYFSVVIADDNSPIGYHPSSENGRFIELQEAKKHKNNLMQSFPHKSFFIVKNTFEKWEVEQQANKKECCNA